MTTMKRREMNIAIAMHYENNVSAFARDFYALGKGHEDKNNTLARIGLSGDWESLTQIGS